MMGDATLVPPNTYQLFAPVDPYESYTATPVLGSATAETSASIRCAQPVSCCQDGFPKYALQPLPAPLHALSVQPRLVPAAPMRLVPPTATTCPSAAGNSTPQPLSPELALTAIPGSLSQA